MKHNQRKLTNHAKKSTPKIGLQLCPENLNTSGPMSEEDGQTGQANEYETDSDYDETEVDGTGLDSDELALIGVQSRKTS